MKSKLKLSLLYWPIALIVMIALANLGPAIIRNANSVGLDRHTRGFPISLCNSGPFADGGISPACSDLAPLGNNLAVLFVLALIVFFILLFLKPKSQTP